jgi:hypothetical protein
MADGTFFICNRTYITKIAVPAFSIVEALDVVEDIVLRFISG